MSAIYVTEDLDNDNVLLATRLNDQPLDRRHGALNRLVGPGGTSLGSEHPVPSPDHPYRPCSRTNPPFVAPLVPRI